MGRPFLAVLDDALVLAGFRSKRKLGDDLVVFNGLSTNHSRTQG
jgi:hypothetical protein